MPDGMREDPMPHAAPPRMKQSDDPVVVSREKKRNAIGRENSEGLLRRVREEAIQTQILLGTAKFFDLSDVRAVNLFGRSRLGREFTLTKDLGKPSRSPRMTVARVREESGKAQVRYWPPLLSVPV